MSSRSTARSIVFNAAVASARASAASERIAMEPSAVGPVAERFVKEVSPVLEHLTNNEPFYQSRVTIGAILSAAGATAALLGYPIAAELQSEIFETAMLWLTVGGLVSGPAVTLYGRWVAKKPLGS